MKGKLKCPRRTQNPAHSATLESRPGSAQTFWLLKLISHLLHTFIFYNCMNVWIFFLLKQQKKTSGVGI